MNTNPYHRPKESAEDRLKKTKFIVEATGFEQHVLWTRFAKESWDRIRSDYSIDWQRISPGWIVTIGQSSDGRPLCIDTAWAELNGVLVCFYYDCSEIMDTKLTREWLEKHCSARISNADNFHHCLDEVDKCQKKDVVIVQRESYYARLRKLAAKYCVPTGISSRGLL